MRPHSGLADGASAFPLPDSLSSPVDHLAERFPHVLQRSRADSASPTGLTVPFALTAGLSSLGSSRLVYTAGIAELVSGALSMGVGGYLSAQAERDHYRYLRKNTRVRLRRSQPRPTPRAPS